MGVINLVEMKDFINCTTFEFLNEYYTKKLPEAFPKDIQRQLIDSAQHGNIESRNMLTESIFRFIYKKAYSNWRPDSELDDLFQVGVIGCIKAIDTFNLELDYNFLTYAGIVISNEIKMYLRSLKLQYHIMSLDEPLYSTDDGEEIYLLDILEDDTIENSPEQYTEAIMLRELVIAEVEKLSERDREMIEYRFGLNGKPKLSQVNIGKIYGCSQANISRIITTILKHMRKNIEFTLH